MAEHPLPRPPGTPIPPTPLPEGTAASPFYPPTDFSHLAPTERRGSLAFLDPYGTPPASPRFAPGPPGSSSPPIGSPSSGSGGGGAANPMRKTPFNFQPSFASKGPVLSKPAQRRGHRYKHSSISLSHHSIPEPPPRAPLSLPASLPLPTTLEALSSITPPQRLRLLWCAIHLLTATYILFSASGSLALTALSHILLFDALGAAVAVAVDILANFDVWKRSTIRHPFGLERAEVLAGFAMAVFLVFMGFDIITHTAEHLLEGFQSASSSSSIPSSPGDQHAPHARVAPGTIDLSALLAILTTLLSTAILHPTPQRLTRTIRLPLPAFLPTLSPTHLLTLLSASLLLTFPFLSPAHVSLLDRLLALLTAAAMLALGTRLITSLGSMLLMSYPPPPPTRAGVGVGVVEGLVKEVERPGGGVKRVLECKVWQVHYGLGMAGLRVVLEKGVEEGGVRERVGRCVKDWLGGGGGGGGGGGEGGMGSVGGGVRWEVSVAAVEDS